MGVRALVDALGDGGDRLLRAAERETGALIDDNARLVAAGLDAAGLHRAAEWTENTGDLVADRLGAEVAEQELGQSDDPKDLLHGDPGRIRAASGRLRRLHRAFDTGRTGLSRLDPGTWNGFGGDAFHAAFTPQPGAWGRAATACQEAADALDHYAFTVEWAQRRAEEAVRLWRRGAEARKKAAAAYNARLDRYAAALAAGPEELPARPGPFTDPGADDRGAAADLLAAARDQRDTAACGTEAAVRSAAGLAPALPDFAGRFCAGTVDLLDTAPIRLEHFAGGLIRSATDAVRFARGLNPYDPYNLTHPAAYVTRLNATAAGLLDLAAHTERLPGLVLGSGWGADSDEASGRLLGNVLLTMATDGGSAAGRNAAGWRNAVPPRGASLDDVRSALRDGPDGLQPVDHADQRALEKVVPRNHDGSFQRYPDPRGPWTGLQNDGGTQVAGRSNNCADNVRAALETWYGNPQVAAARTLSRAADGTLDVLSAERFGVENGNVWGGTAFGYTGPGPAAYERVADEVRGAGHGSSAFVHVEWPPTADGVRTSHVFTALNHGGEVFWFDPQAGIVSTDPIHAAARHVFHYVLDADRRPVTRRPAVTAAEE
ncbi:toxin glutamine deamidase domain-containing protein [Streptomyces cocklensis]|uniref:Papain fold toxin 1, glutamine deamidase n=1 Tax=Actinacidiphila cocklensis TaxID=887465 RepID=A0A9W4DWF2_9ACTN|nr:toxin glutamine deamidase domain-containing protein [Actinacidiphila cocklensis]MDD1060003.1 toxin glutamine deamidase domain-containing protein [Actinacidiphila cocklensis]CAG6397277.1 Papain fold toxin 1, glutamine deamidase [Actinacidiphila cocklensis]